MTEQPSVIFLDLNMPGMDGLAVLETIKGDPRLKLIPVVVFTGSEDSGELLKSYDLGANSLIRKSGEVEEFLGKMRTAGAMWASLNVPPPSRLIA